MSGCGCNNGSTPQGPTPDPRSCGPEVRVYKFLGDDRCAGISSWFENLTQTTFNPPEYGEQATLPVKDPCKYPPGTCVVVFDEQGNQRVLKVASILDKAISVYSYQNAFEIGGNLSGRIYVAPVAVCPLAIGNDAPECDRDYMVTSESFVAPIALPDGGSVKIVFDKPQTLAVGMTVFITGAGRYEITTPPSGPFVSCSTEFYAYNNGAAGNAVPGAVISAGKAAWPEAALAAATTQISGGFRRIQNVASLVIAQNTDIPFGLSDFDTFATNAVASINGAGSVLTIQVEGIYHFNVSFAFDRNSWVNSANVREPHICIFKNGVKQAHGNSIHSQTIDGLSACGVTLYCQAGDTVSVRWLDTGTPGAVQVNGEYVANYEFSTWSGHLVSAG